MNSRRLFLTGSAVLAIAAVPLALCLLAVAQNSNYTQDPNWKAPPQAAARQNSLKGNAQVIAGGRKVFHRECLQCHGEDGSGLANAANLHLPVVQQQSDGTLFWKISNGNPGRGMPSFSSLPELQRWQLVLYIRTLGKAELKEK